MANDPPLTAGEKARIAYLAARMAKRCLAGEHVYRGDLERKVDRIIDGAHKRAEQQAKSK